MTEETFIKITNKDIYSQLKDINHRLDCIEGSIKTQKWISVTAISLCLMTLGFLIQHIMTN